MSSIDETMKLPIHTEFEVKKDDPIYIWLKANNALGENLNLISILSAMPAELGEEFIRRMITAQVVGVKDADTVRRLSKLAFMRQNEIKPVRFEIYQKEEWGES